MVIQLCNCVCTLPRIWRGQSYPYICILLVDRALHWSCPLPCVDKQGRAKQGQLPYKCNFFSKLCKLHFWNQNTSAFLYPWICCRRQTKLTSFHFHLHHTFVQNVELTWQSKTPHTTQWLVEHPQIILDMLPHGSKIWQNYSQFQKLF